MDDGADLVGEDRVVPGSRREWRNSGRRRDAGSAVPQSESTSSAAVEGHCLRASQPGGRGIRRRSKARCTASQRYRAWTADWRVIATILGWLLTIGGVISMVLPQFTATLATTLYSTSTGLMVFAAVVLVLGGYLTFEGYRS
jgi:hypothetical protein